VKSPLAALNVKPEEQLQVLLMLGTGFFMGIFIATYQVTAESLFINKLSDQLDKAFLISGILGIAATLLFSLAQNRIKFTTLTISSILSIVIISMTIYYLYHFADERLHNFVLFAMFCLIGPITAVLLLCYWGIFGRLFNFKQSKRIIGWIDTGQLVAALLAYFIIPLTARFFPDTSNYLIICNVSILCSLACLLIISTRFSLTKNNPADFEASVRTETKFSRIFKDKYVVLLSLFIVISMVTYVLNQYSFQNLINRQYPDQRDLTNFLAYFNGAIYVLSFLMQTYVNDKIISNYGLRVSLYVLPVVVGVFAIGTFITGSVFGYSLDTSPTTFIFFFLFIALTRLFNGMIKDSLENPVFKLLFIPIDNRYRFGIQAKVEGVVNEVGRLVAGILIFSFAILPFFKVIWIPMLIILLCGAYLFIVTRLHNGYKGKIREKLESTDFHQDKLEIGYAQVTARLEGLLSNQDTSKAVFSLRLLEKINPAGLGGWVNNLMKNTREEAKDYAQRRMNELKGLSVSERYVIKMDKNNEAHGSKNVLSKSDLQLIIASGGDITKTRIIRLSRSTEVEDRQYAAELLLHSSADENTSFLIELLNDPEPKVRHTAIKTSIKKNNNEVIHAVIENLGNSIYSNQAMNALVLIGGKALNLLDSSFYRSGQNAQVLQRIIQTMGRIGGQRAKDLLWNKIDYPDKVIVSQVLLSLGECGFKAGISQMTRIKYAIESDIGDISWNLSALDEIGDDDNTAEVRHALEREIQNDIEHVYMLLAMLYDTRSIQLVKENIESGTSEGTTYAVELLDVFLSEQLKQRVIPVLDDLTIGERVARLEAFYPRVRLDEKLVLKFLINRDFAQANRWTKACVLHQIGVQQIEDFTLDLIAQLFNPDRIVREVAAWSLYQINPETYRTNVLRLGDQTQQELDSVITLKGFDAGLMLFDKVNFYQKIEVFKGIPGITLSFLADISQVIKLATGQSVSIDEKLNNYFFIVFKGSVEYYQKGSYNSDFKEGLFIGEMLSAPGFMNSNLIVAKENTVLLKLPKELFYELLSNNVKLADKVLEYI